MDGESEPHGEAARPSARRIDELRRRRVVRTALVYAAGAWASLQVADLVFPLFGLNHSAVRWVLWMLSAGFVLSIAIAWLSEIRTERGEEPISLLSNHTMGLVLLVLGIGAIAGIGVDPWLEEEAHDPLAATITVLPFETRGESGASQTLAEHLAEDITAALSRFDGLAVVHPSLVRTSADDEVPARSDLGARFVLEGSVQSDAERIRIRARLFDTTGGLLLWSRVYDRSWKSSDLLDLQRDIASRISATVADRTGVIAHEARYTGRRRRTNHRPMAECLALANRYFEIHTDEQHAMARECLEHAVEREPDDAEAWAHLAYLYREEHLHRRNERLSPLDRALRAADRAVALGPNSAMAHFALATTYFSLGELDAATMAAERSIELNRNDATLLGLLSTQLAVAGHWDRAVEVAGRAAELSPHHPTFLHNVLALDHYRRGEYTEALETHRRVGSLDTMRGVTRAAVLGQIGRSEEAGEVMEALLRTDPHLKMDTYSELQRLYVSDDLVQSLAEGLRMAGIDLVPPRERQETRHSFPTRSRGNRSKPTPEPLLEP